MRSRAAVSVVIPCFRSAGTIDRAVRSVLDQTLRAEEIILVDDASDDGSVHALEKLARRESSIRLVVRSENGGPGDARNAGWSICSQPYIAFLDADDSWHPRKLEIQYGWMAQRPQVRLTGHRIAQAGTSVASAGAQERIRVRRIDRMAVLLSNPFHTSSVMIRSDVGLRFETGKRYAEDYLLWGQLVLRGEEAHHLGVVLGYRYKPLYGAEGLSGHVTRMERGALSAYRHFYHQGLISAPVFVAVSVLSIAKFVKRLLVMSLRTSSGRSKRASARC